MSSAEQEAREIVNEWHLPVGTDIDSVAMLELTEAITSALTRKERVIETLRTALEHVVYYKWDSPAGDVARTALAKAKEMENE